MKNPLTLSQTVALCLDVACFLAVLILVGFVAWQISMHSTVLTYGL